MTSTRWFVVCALAVMVAGGETARAACDQAEIKKKVQTACAEIQKDGEKAFAKLMQPEFNGACESYVWVQDEKDSKVTMVFHPVSTSLIGKPMNDVTDPGGKHIFTDFAKAAPKKGGSGWVQYQWQKPKSTEIAPKCSFVMNCDGRFTAGMGIYSSCPAIGVKSHR